MEKVVGFWEKKTYAKKFDPTSFVTNSINLKTSHQAFLSLKYDSSADLEVQLMQLNHCDGV